ncbi:MAG: Fe(3+) dicitrate transport ATP-binding protein FecE [Candidatus Celerinatantimonas neptuna]|nr:MAG: Fe(3+) dicitrate transport ATP-binding protein FecE [Candidatus Celerinatantimonas neptuna]
MLKISQLSVGYQGNPLISKINMTITPGKIYALIGPNGCGKSTILKTIAQQQPSIEGEILWENKPVSSLSHRQRAKLIAMLAQQNTSPEGINVEQLVAFGRTPYNNWWGKLSKNDHQIINHAIEICQLAPLRQQSVSALSGGQRQRAWLAMSLAQQSQYLFLDEPTTYLDLNHQVSLMGILNQLKTQGKSVVCVLHDINQACRYCDEIIVVANGQIYTQGHAKQILTPKLLQDVFNVKAVIEADPVTKSPMMFLTD